MRILQLAQPEEGDASLGDGGLGEDGLGEDGLGEDGLGEDAVILALLLPRGGERREEGEFVLGAPALGEALGGEVGCVLC